MERPRPEAGLCLAALLALGLVCLRSARAQSDFDNNGEDVFGTSLHTRREREREAEKLKPRPRPVSPFAAALYVSVSSADWRTVGLSTAAPREELSGYLDRGFYRLELVEIVLMAARARQDLRGLLRQRGEGRTLAELAKGLGLPYEALYAEALALRGRVEARLKALVPSSTATALGDPDTVGISTAPEEDGP